MAIDHIAETASIAPPATPSATASSGGMSFRTFLSDINPLQYIPVVGALYRATTGDEGNPTLRFVASLGTSFALGGPVALGITVAEKVTGIDPEKIARSLLGRLLHHAAPPAQIAAAGAAAGAATDAAASGRPWTGAELSAYANASGETSQAEMLNGLELQRLSATYA